MAGLCPMYVLCICLLVLCVQPVRSPWDALLLSCSRCLLGWLLASLARHRRQSARALTPCHPWQPRRHLSLVKPALCIIRAAHVQHTSLAALHSTPL